MINQQSNPVAPSDLQFINTLADGLGEKPFTSGYHQLHIAVQILGGRAVMELAQRALAIYQGEGMLTLEGKKRTLGGCFFRLLKDELTPEQLSEFYQLRSAGQRRAQHGHDKPGPTAAVATKPTTQPVAPAKPQAKKSVPAAQPPQAKKPVAPVKAGQAEGKRKPMAPAVNRQKSGKVER